MNACAQSHTRAFSSLTVNPSNGYINQNSLPLRPADEEERRIGIPGVNEKSSTPPRFRKKVSEMPGQQNSSTPHFEYPDSHPNLEAHKWIDTTLLCGNTEYDWRKALELIGRLDNERKKRF